MAGIDLALAQARLASWIAADEAVTKGQQYEIATAGGSRMLRRADAAEIRANIDYWDRQVRRLTINPDGLGRRLNVTTSAGW